MSAKTQTLIDRVVTLINTLTTGGGYNWTVSSAANEARIFFTEPRGKYPVVDVLATREDNDYDPASIVQSTLWLSVRGAVKGINLSGCENLAADVKNVLATDDTLNGNCISCIPRSVVKDGGFMANSTFEMELEIRYEHAFGSA